MTINVTVLLAVIVVWRLRRRTRSRSRFDEKLTVVIGLALSILISPTPAGEGILNILGQLASGVTPASRWPPHTRGPDDACWRTLRITGRGSGE